QQGLLRRGALAGDRGVRVACGHRPGYVGQIRLQEFVQLENEEDRDRSSLRTSRRAIVAVQGRRAEAGSNLSDPGVGLWLAPGKVRRGGRVSLASGDRQLTSVDWVAVTGHCRQQRQEFLAGKHAPG